MMARITGLARSTIYHGLSDVRHQATAPPGRIRKEGGGRKKKSVQDPSLLADLKELVEPATRGDPTQLLLWTSRSLRHLVKDLAQKGHMASPTVVGDLNDIAIACGATARREKVGSISTHRGSQTASLVT